MSFTLVLSFFLVLARVQATRILEGHGGTMQDVEMIGAVGNSVQEQRTSDARVRDAVDEIRGSAVQLIKDIDDAAKSGSEWEFCGLSKICRGDRPKCCHDWVGITRISQVYVCKPRSVKCDDKL
ncbi:unnamed protein product [Symbiodinium necroappetens]|uniref:Uncharacterized protein n=1 Tax=Symbiodinium necroappetens TaxID=1628268 RepID=A0A812RRV3_9DINO|nr:unnamed protein product [Symbiodinium necroappetens]